MGMRSYKSLAGLALALVTGFARADTVTFDDLPHHHAATNLGPEINDGGFTFLSQQDLYAPSRRDDADPRGQTLASVLPDEVLYAFKSDGSAFDLTSLDLGSLPVGGGGGGDGQGDDDHRHRRYHGSDNGGFAGSSGDIELFYFQGTNPDFLTTILHLDDKPGLQSFELDLNDVTLFALYGVPFQLDNVVITSGGATAPVPEPDSFAAIVAGLALLGTLARRRNSCAPRMKGR